jgi:CRP-like cAMP-binding protein
MDQSLTLEAVINFLLETPLFGELNPSELAEVVKIMQMQGVRDGEDVFREGEKGDAWYVLFSGVARVTKGTAFGEPREVANLESHACFGEMAVLDDSARSASVTAAGDIKLFRFPRRPFQQLLLEGNLAAYKLVYGMARVLCKRQRSLTLQMSSMMEDESIERRVLQNQLGDLLDRYRVSE